MAPISLVLGREGTAVSGHGVEGSTATSGRTLSSVAGYRHTSGVSLTTTWASTVGLTRAQVTGLHRPAVVSRAAPIGGTDTTRITARSGSPSPKAYAADGTALLCGRPRAPSTPVSVGSTAAPSLGCLVGTLPPARVVPRFLLLVGA